MGHNSGVWRGKSIRLTWLLTVMIAGLFLGNCSAWRPDAQQNGARGRAALRSGDYQKAREYFEVALRESPKDDDSHAGLAAALREVGRYAEALRLGEAFLSSRNASAAVQLEMGRSAAVLGRLADAEKHLRQARALSQAGDGPLLLAADRELGDLLEGTGRAREASAIWEEMVAKYRKGDVRGSKALGDVGVAVWRLGMIQDAKDIFMDATDPKASREVSIEALSDFGYLFLDKYAPADAISCFRDCLRINPSYPRALMGIALAKKYESNAETESYARAALKVNPNFVPAINLLAELAYDEESYAAGLAEVQRALSVNPGNLETLSLEAVCYQTIGDPAKFGEAEKKILQIHPGYGRLYYSLGESLVMRRKYKEAVDQYRKAVELDPALWAAYAGLGMNLMRVGDLTEGRRMIERAFEGDPFNLWAFNTLELLDQMDKFARVRNKHFVLLVSKEDESVLAPYLVRLADEAYTVLTRRYGFAPNGPIQVEVFPDHGGFAVRTLGLPGLGALGVCFGPVVAMDSPRARKPGDFNWGSTFWHEFTHVITLQMTKHNIPRWYSEGLSVCEERRARPGWGDDLTAGFVKAFKDGKLLKVHEFNAGLMRPKFPEQIAYTYYQASLFCNMIEERFGFNKIRQSLDLFAENKPADEVFRLALGWDPQTLESEYARFLEKRLQPVAARLDFQVLKKDVKTGLPETPGRAELASWLEKKPDDFFANLQMGLLLRKDGATHAAEAYLGKAESLFPEFVETGSPYQVLSELYLEEGREDEALAQFLGWAKYDENAVLPLMRAAEIFSKRKDWSNAVNVLQRAVYAYPLQTEVHQMLGEAAVERGDWSTAVAAYQVCVGLNPPDLAGAYYDLARAWLGSGDRQEARRATLRALEIAPSFEKAQQLLLKLRNPGR
jgi:tetratricopeptide (TPR) repeat protein